MKTLTEFSPLVLRRAADALAKARAAHPRTEPAAGEAPASAPAPSEPAAEAPAEAAAGEPAGEAPAEAPAEAAPSGPDPVVEAVAADLGVQADRAARLVEALDIIGDRIDQVRLVRVYQGEKGPTNSLARGEFHYVIDRVAAPPRRGRDRDDRPGREGRDRGPGGRGGRDRDKPRGLGSLKAGASKEERDPRDDRPGRGEMPRAGIGWQLTSAPRDFEGRGRGPKRGPRRGPGGPGGPSGPGDRRDDRGPRGDRRGRGPRPYGDRGPRDVQAGPGAPDQLQPGGEPGRSAPHEARPPQPPRLGPDGMPLPPRKKRPRKPIGPDANGLGPDGTPWDPERRAKRLAERAAQPGQEGAAVNTAGSPAVEAPQPAASPETPTE